MSRRVAVVLAGGVGARVGLDIPKQLIKIAGHTILEHTVKLLDAHPAVDEIVVMMTPTHVDEAHAIVGGYAKVSQVLPGADTRNGTTLRALDAVGDDDTMVLLHDAVRPLLSARIISDCFTALETHDAVDVAIPSADTLIVVGADNTIEDIPPRANFRRGQTPQAFRAGAIRAAYALAVEDPDFQATDDCTVILRYTPDVPIWVVAGEERNMKVTEPIDVYLADKLFQLGSDTIAPEHDEAGYRAELADKVLVVLGGSYGIGADLAALATSYGAKVFTFSRSTTGTHVESRDDVRRALEGVLEETGRIDFVVNSAATLTRGALVETTDEAIRRSTDVNFLAPVVIAQESHDALAASRGSMLNFTSSSYTRGRSGYSLYSAAKAGVVNLTQALADEWAADGIRVNCVNPERTGTPMRTNAFGEEPSGSLLESVEVARRSLDLLLSRETGQILDIRRDDPL